MKMKRMKRDEVAIEKLHEELARFETTMQELSTLRLIADDLKSYKRMIRLKRYD
jgi:hypothetical protein